MSDTEKEPRQLLHLVFGGELESLEGTDFTDLDALDIVGIYPNYAEAEKAWRAKAPGDVLALVALGRAYEANKQPAWAARSYGSIIDQQGKREA